MLSTVETGLCQASSSVMRFDMDILEVDNILTAGKPLHWKFIFAPFSERFCTSSYFFSSTVNILHICFLWVLCSYVIKIVIRNNSTNICNLTTHFSSNITDYLYFVIKLRDNVTWKSFTPQHWLLPIKRAHVPLKAPTPPSLYPGADRPRRRLCWEWWSSPR